MAYLCTAVTILCAACTYSPEIYTDKRESVAVANRLSVRSHPDHFKLFQYGVR